MNRLDELAGWAAANEDQMAAFLGHLDELVADRVPVAIDLAERIREEKSGAWVHGFGDGERMARSWGHTDCWPAERPANPYEAEAGDPQ